MTPNRKEVGVTIRPPNLINVDLTYRSLLEVTNVLNSQRDTESLFNAIAEQIKRVTPWQRTGITLYDSPTDSFRFYAMETSMVRVFLQKDAVIPREGSAIGWAYDNHRPHIRPNLHKERIFLEDELFFQEGLGRMMNFPLLVRGTCLGTLNIGSAETGEPDPHHLEFLQQVATQIAFAVDSVRSYEQINRLREQLAKENEYLAEEIKLTNNFGAMVGKSNALREVMRLAETVAQTSSSVLITGETGTGKELLARAIHEMSARRDKPFVRVNCAALPHGLVESELFGHERGAFTGASQRRQGRFELADGGTLFLDEIGQLPLEAQSKLLRVLQDGHVDRVGGRQPVSVDVRILAATNTELIPAIEAGLFRSDLFYRLNVFPITVPPLRERPEDICLLARYFVEQYRLKLKRPCRDISDESLARLVRYSWPGNVRELQNVIERAVILARSVTVEIDGRLLATSGSLGQNGNGSPTRLQDLEHAHIRRTLEQTDWRIDGPRGAAQRLGLNPSTLRSRLKKLGIKRPEKFLAQ
jgi:formate hydrogenlyase transcriptional activator